MTGFTKAGVLSTETRIKATAWRVSPRGEFQYPQASRGKGTENSER